MTYYDILEISEKASPEVIRMAYKALCKKYHPDVFQGDKNFAESQMKKINEAYEILSDKAKRRQYDATLNSQRPYSNQNTYSPPRQENTYSVDALLKRGFMALETGDWLKADQFFEQVLNIKAEKAEAYLGKLMAELRVRTREDLKNCVQPFDDKSNYKRAITFADDSLKNFLDNTTDFIKKRNYETECNDIYYRACKSMHHDNDINCLENAISLFEKISHYKDSHLKIKECQEKINSLKEKIEKEEQIKAEKIKKNKILAAIIIPTISVVLIVCIVLATTIPSIYAYNNALDLINKEEYTTAISILETLGDYKNSKELILETKFSYANKLCEEKNYLAAIRIFEELKGYKNSDEFILEVHYLYAFNLYEGKMYTEAKEEFKKVINYKDSEKYITLCTEQLNEEKYQKALSLIKENNIIDAYLLFGELSSINYKDSTMLKGKYLESYNQAKFNNKLKTLRIGNIIEFGTYEQDDNLGNGKEPIEWIVIDKNTTSILLISKKILDAQRYHEDSFTDDKATWEKCSLRKWLNGTFYNAAFNSSEKQKIANTTVVPDPKEYSTSPDPGNKTIDKVYLLSKNEYNQYSDIDGLRPVECTKHTIAKNDRMMPRGQWLRSPYYNDPEKAEFILDTFIDSEDKWYREGIRPVIWVKFE